MEKRTYFDSFDSHGWPDTEQLARYFLTEAGRRKFFAAGNDSWGLKAHGVDGTDNLQPFKDRIDIDLTILGHPDLGILLCYFKFDKRGNESYYSRGDLNRLREWVMTVHGDKMPVGLYIPFETAWGAVREFIETNGNLPRNIAWVAARDLPEGTFPEP